MTLPPRTVAPTDEHILRHAEFERIAIDLLDKHRLYRGDDSERRQFGLLIEKMLAYFEQEGDLDIVEALIRNLKVDGRMETLTAVLLFFSDKDSLKHLARLRDKEARWDWFYAMLTKYAGLILAGVCGATGTALLPYFLSVLHHTKGAP